MNKRVWIHIELTGAIETNKKQYLFSNFLIRFYNIQMFAGIHYCQLYWLYCVRVCGWLFKIIFQESFSYNVFLKDNEFLLSTLKLIHVKTHFPRQNIRSRRLFTTQNKEMETLHAFLLKYQKFFDCLKNSLRVQENRLYLFRIFYCSNRREKKNERKMENSQNVHMNKHTK